MIISIIMPAYNAEKYIDEAIESVLAQTYQKWQLIIVDDGSTDGTLEIAKEYAKSDEQKGKRILVVHQKNSGTASAARNTALEYATGEYVQILDADDYLSNDCLEKCVNVINQNDDVDIISPIAMSVDDSGNRKKEIAKVSRFVGRKIDGEQGFLLSLDWTIHGCFCTRMDIIKKIRFDPLLINGDEFTTRKLLYNARGVAFTDAVYFYRDNSQSTTKSLQNNVRMFESLWTDKNIYNYSEQNSMSQNVQEQCWNKRIRSLVAYQAKYNRERKQYNKEQQVFAEKILRENYEEISMNWRRKKPTSIFGILVCLSGNNYQLFCNLVQAYNWLWKILKR